MPEAVAEGEAAPEAAKETKPEADPMAVEDVCNAGDGKPIFAMFGLEDWVLLNLWPGLACSSLVCLSAEACGAAFDGQRLSERCR